jgi:hypothetical protein
MGTIRRANGPSRSRLNDRVPSLRAEGEAIQSNRSMIAALALDCFVVALLAMTAATQPPHPEEPRSGVSTENQEFRAPK